MAFAAKLRISLIARGALFLNETPWTYVFKPPHESVFRPKYPHFTPLPFPCSPSPSLVRELETETDGGREGQRVMWRMDFIKLISDGTYFYAPNTCALKVFRLHIHVYVGGLCIRGQRRRQLRNEWWQAF